MAAIDNVNRTQLGSDESCPNCGSGSHSAISCPTRYSDSSSPVKKDTTSAPQVLRAGFLADFGKVGYKDARDIAHEYDHLESTDQSFEDYMRTKKLNRAKETGLHDSIRSEGVRTPVRLYVDSDRPDLNPTVVSGHHRIFSAADVNPDMDVPVEYTHDWWDTKPLPKKQQRTVHRDISGRQD